MINLRILGTPRPQGSLRLFRSKNGHEVARYADATYVWRGVVTAAVRAEFGECAPITGAVRLEAVFELPRPRGHYGTGRNAEALRSSAPCWPTGAPDLDKLLRLIDDAVSDAGCVWLDDAQVVEIRARKKYAAVEPSCTIRIFPVENP